MIKTSPNVTPFYDASDNPTGCCPRFNPEGWDGAEMAFQDKPFLRATTISVAHVPLNMGKVFSRVQTALDATKAVPPDQTLVLSRDLSAFSAEHLFAVDKPVPDEEMTTLTGHFLTKVFEGPYWKAREWQGAMQDLAREKGKEPGPVWMFYTTCPKCAKVYGKNPVVGVVQVDA